MIRRLASQTWVHVTFGAVLMGSWSFYANRHHEVSETVRAAVLQAALSGFLTACLKMIADRLLRFLPHWSLAAGTSLLFSATLLLAAHRVSGTPELAATVSVPLLVSGSYIFAYCYIRRRPSLG
ncbi:hypothetical protein C8D95_101867 [Silicimonas algicola]|uniref:Uncharacterized protein n=1 Tax=Silicimonas algicola TaxID=1826607 RepID=A0A316GFP2_9RHOB|nr:hypothetical protein C8D95_101867 [Silicimonas algicola]